MLLGIAIAFTLQSLAAGAAPETQTILVEPEAPLLLVFALPSPAMQHLRLSDLIDGWADAIRAVAPVATREIDTPEARACITSPTVTLRLTCLVDATRDREGKHVSRYLVVVSGLGAESGDRIAIITIDLELAEKVRTQSELLEVAADITEEGIRRQAVVATMAKSELLDATMSSAFFSEAAGGRLREIITETARRQTYGSIALTTTMPGLVVTIDGRPLGTMTSTAISLMNVPVGVHEVGLVGPLTFPFRESVTVAERQVTNIDARPELTNPPVYGWAYPSLLVAGGVLVAGGTVLAAVGGDRQYCVVRNAECSRYLTNPQIAGIATAIGGATLAVSSLLFRDDTRLPWLEVLISTAVGFVAYAALQPIFAK